MKKIFNVLRMWFHPHSILQLRILLCLIWMWIIGKVEWSNEGMVSFRENVDGR